MINVNSLIRQWVKRDPIRFQSLQADMIAARTGITIERYLKRSILVALLAGVFFSLIGYLFSGFFAVPKPGGQVGIYNVFNLPIPDAIAGISAFLLLQGVMVVVAFTVGGYVVS
jgi:flagellar protein FlaJ